MMEAKISAPSPSKIRRKSYSQATAPALRAHCFMQTHDSDNNSENFAVQIWCCKFKPDSPDIVATCGGETVCIIDANGAKVKSKFYKQGEEFYTLDWARVDSEKFDSNILACGGCLGTVYLIHTEQFCVYGYFRAHTKPVQSLCFVPDNPAKLLTAGNEKKIYLWDIGELSLPDYHFCSKKLAMFDGLHFSPLKMLVFQQQYLFCATEGGLLCWHVEDSFAMDNSTKSKKFSSPSEVQFLFVEDEPVVDGLEIINDNLVATKCAQSGVIFLWKPSSLLGKVKQGKSPVKADLVDELKWSNTEQLYLNIAVADNRYLFAGDEQGSIWIYDCNHSSIETNTKSKAYRYIPGKPRPALEIVNWPICEREDQSPVDSVCTGSMINYITCGSGLQYLIAATDNNLICIYKIAL